MGETFLSKETALAILEGAKKKYRKTFKTKAVCMNQPFTIDQRGVMVFGQVGDYLVLDAEGLPYLCSASLFNESYVEIGHKRVKEATTTDSGEGQGGKA